MSILIDVPADVIHMIACKYLHKNKDRLSLAVTCKTMYSYVTASYDNRLDSAFNLYELDSSDRTPLYRALRCDVDTDPAVRYLLSNPSLDPYFAIKDDRQAKTEFFFSAVKRSTLDALDVLLKHPRIDPLDILTLSLPTTFTFGPPREMWPIAQFIVQHPRMREAFQRTPQHPRLANTKTEECVLAADLFETAVLRLTDTQMYPQACQWPLLLLTTPGFTAVCLRTRDWSYVFSAILDVSSDPSIDASTVSVLAPEVCTLLRAMYEYQYHEEVPSRARMKALAHRAYEVGVSGRRKQHRLAQRLRTAALIQAFLDTLPDN